MQALGSATHKKMNSMLYNDKFGLIGNKKKQEEEDFFKRKKYKIEIDDKFYL